MVEKLQLKRKKHPNPYRVTWLQRDHQILVSEKILVQFHIVNYVDEVLCDVMPMDICHVLLGRLWKYHRHAMYDGWENMYTITKDR